MKTIKEFIIFEKLTDVQQKLVGEYIINLFKGSNLHKDKISSMLKAISSPDDMGPLKEIEEYIEKIDKTNAFPYLAGKDEFLKKDNYEKIVDNFSQYIYKYIAN